MHVNTIFIMLYFENAKSHEVWRETAENQLWYTDHFLRSPAMCVYWKHWQEATSFLKCNTFLKVVKKYRICQVIVPLTPFTLRSGNTTFCRKFYFTFFRKCNNMHIFLSNVWFKYFALKPGFYIPSLLKMTLILSFSSEDIGTVM